MEFVVFLWIGFLALGMYVAKQKGRSQWEGFLLAFWFGPIGVFVEALLPTLDTSGPRKAQADAAAVARRLDEQGERLRADRLASQQRAEERRFVQAEQAVQVRERRRLERIANREAADNWYRDRGIKPGPWAWYQALPDWLQPILLGAAVAVPLGLALAIGMSAR